MITLYSCISLICYYNLLIKLDQQGSLGTDAFLGMDTEEGVEVVWNEIWLSEGKSRNYQKVRLCKINDMQFSRPNYIKNVLYQFSDKLFS